jgi:hypothetical protein
MAAKKNDPAGFVAKATGVVTHPNGSLVELTEGKSTPDDELLKAYPSLFGPVDADDESE